MKINFLFFLLSVFLQLSCSHTPIETEVDIILEDQNCYRDIAFGDINICLAEITDMTECYSSNIDVKTMLDNITLESSSTFAAYITDSQLENSNGIKAIGLGEHVRVYVYNPMKNQSYTQSDLKNIGSSIDNNYLKENWDRLKTKINTSDVTYNKAILIDSYSSNANTITKVLFTAFSQKASEDYYLVNTLNLVRIKNRIIFLGYFNRYDGQNSVERAKKKNDDIIVSLLAKNKSL